MLFFVCLFACLTAIKAGSHSLMTFATYIVGQTPFPEFSVVLLLDDVQLGYYESTTWSVMNRTQSNLKYHDDEENDAGLIFRAMYNSMKSRANYLVEHLNHTDGVHVHQRLAGCALLNDGKPGVVQSTDAFDGQNMEDFTFDMEKNEILMNKPWMITWNEIQWLSLKLLYGKICHPICIKTLRRYLDVRKNIVMRKVKPRVRLMKKKLPDSQGLQISCLATGFYPRHINLTLFRGAEPVDEDQITGGEILPNGDGTYQMRKSLIISEEELHEGHNYNCTMKHLNLDNKMDIVFDTDKYDPGHFLLSIVIGVLMLMLVSVLTITALIMRRKRRAAGKLTGRSSEHKHDLVLGGF